VHRQVALTILQPALRAIQAASPGEAQVLSGLTPTSRPSTAANKAMMLAHWSWNLVEGPTLADRIKEGPIPIATQIAEDLEAAPPLNVTDSI
jgi:hypothetical protein